MTSTKNTRNSSNVDLGQMWADWVDDNLSWLIPSILVYTTFVLGFYFVYEPMTMFERNYLERLKRQQNIAQQITNQYRQRTSRDSVRLRIVNMANEYDIPVKLSRQIFNIANESQIPAKIVFSLIERESNFDSLAVSEDNAIGLMQVRPFVARTIQPNISANDLFNPQKNVFIGVQYLERLVSRYGNMESALHAYYVGPTHYDNGIYKSSGQEYATSILTRSLSR